MIALSQLIVQLATQAPADLRLVPEVDIDLQLVPADQPGWSRRPDLVVVDQKAVDPDH
jgi:hypothetical protein